MKNKENILIIGAGLCGSLLALRMAQRGYQVQLIEKRPDLRKTDISAGRSINLAFSNRGIKAMKLVGLEQKALKICIPMNGRMIHDQEENTFLSPYSGLEHEYINSISRTDLNALMLDEAEKMENVSIQFNQECLDVNSEKATATFKNYHSGEETTIVADLIFGTDGAGSALRKSMMNDRSFLFSFSQDYLQHGYKELTIEPSVEGDFQLYKNALHIWPRGENMLIALPNLDGSFTVTLFMSYAEGDYNFNNITSAAKAEEYFEKYYPDALKLMPNLGEEFFENPTGALGTVKCSPWYSHGKSLLMGDAAHAIVPFYGQGMNASFEDVVVFDEALENHTGDWETTFKAYQKARKKDTDAIADLAIDNFYEMKEHTAAPIFQQKRKLETALEQEFPAEYASKYRLVTFQEQIGYAEAMRRGRAQDKAMLRLISEEKITDDLSLEEKLKLVKEETKTILEEDTVAY
ncbi:FAD-dependent oxidoreductase [Mesonia mobilis]|uniref:Kynurenine 3-monooxygenase n=1 Tax=Mesonia mobilis TaxID=369791 RepID=A0ABQ3BIS9_9FLAO|nr:NAD(P)/FAD-dependent oxidoreductase [Mesonia mobilis]MBQ0738930.1 FAD-dependent monooxygenase [Aquimarina celericrescens]GGZ47240.1 kynurenine 3-monooxygenase [Mesonia mobilis]